MNLFDGKPVVVMHRINTIEGLKNVGPRFGVEIDIRHDTKTGRLYLNHDPGTGDDFEEFMKVFVKQGNRFVIFNVKEAGIETSVINTAKKAGAENFFLLDVEFPFIYRSAYGDLRHLTDKRIAIRFSEAEPIKQALRLAGKFDWVWIDVNTKFPLNKQSYKQLRDAGFKLALVCPERWGRPQDISAYIAKMKRDGIMVDTVMTAAPYAEQWEKSGVLRPFHPRK